jgi:group I intron endonuclease
MKTSGIYRIDLGNGWFYIGSAQNLERRKRQHRSALDRKDHFNRVMQRCWNKYGIFEFVILQKCATDELIIYEQTHLDKHFDNPRNVNLASTAGSSLGNIHSIETKAKMSAAGKRRRQSAETRAKISAKLTGRVLSVETRAKMSEANRRRVLSNETRAKISESGRVAWVNRRVKQMNKNIINK